MEESPRFPAHLEELRILRERVATMERELAARGEHASTEELIRHEITRLQAEPVSNKDAEITIELIPDNNDEIMADFLALVQSEGIGSALRAVEKLDNPHLMDDVHRFLVQYIKQGYTPAGLKPGSSLGRELSYTLLEVRFPRTAKEDEERGGEPPVNHGAVKQFLQGISALGAISRRAGVHIAVELASPLSSTSVVSYVAMPDEALELVSQQLRAAFPGVLLVPAPDDHNVFVEGGSSLMRVASLARPPVLPLTLAGEGITDALRSMYIALSSVGPERGAAIQFIIRPGDGSFSQYGRRVIEALQQGSSRSEALKIPRTQVGAVAKEIFTAIFNRKSDEDAVRAKNSVDTDTLALVNEKLSTAAHDVVIRVVASSGDEGDAAALLDHLVAPFAQFARSEGNAIVFTPLYVGERDFSYRAFSVRHALSLTVGELAVMVPLGSRGDIDLPELTQVKSTEIPAPTDLPTTGLYLGTNVFRGKERVVYLTPEDRLRHLYIIGQTGTGKSTFLKHIAAQDIQNGNGMCFIDPHGSDVLDLLAAVPPERYGDVIYFDPAHRERVFGLNLLEYDPAYPEQKTFVVNELLGIFKRLYSAVPESMGPAFEQYFRNATQLVMEDPASGNTMLDIARVLTDATFRELKLSRSKNVEVNQFWTSIATQAGGESKLENIVPYITNKFDDFTANDLMRPIIGQERSTLHFRDIMDSRKILLVNLAKGRLGERNAHLLGLILVGKMFMAALSRVDATEPLPPFYMYLDEFQNITTDSITHILSEARKYGLGLTIAHQFMSQIPEDIHDAVFGNVGSIVAFRVGSKDAEDLLREFGDAFKGNDLMNIENYHAHIRMLANGVPQSSFTLAVPPLMAGDRAQIDDLRTLSYLTYAKDREDVEETIRRKMGF